MNEEILRHFIEQMNLLRNRFIHVIESMPAPYNSIVVRPEPAQFIVDVFDYNSPRLSFEKPVFHSNSFPGKTLSFEADSMNAPFGKLWLSAPEGDLELVMGVFDLTLYNGDWYYFPPIGINGPIRSNATPINNDMIRSVIIASFNPDALTN